MLGDRPQRLDVRAQIAAADPPLDACAHCGAIDGVVELAWRAESDACPYTGYVEDGAWVCADGCAPVVHAAGSELEMADDIEAPF